MESKIFTYCKKEKDISSFYKITNSHCKECEKERAKKVYTKNPEPYKERAKEGKKKLKTFLTDFLFNLKKDSGCRICNEKEVACLDFHHIIKGRPVTRVANHSFTSTEKELNKCIIVCCNCHRKIHANLINVDESMIINVKVPRPKSNQ